MNDSAFNDDQQAYMRYLNTLAANEKCLCRWYPRGDCPNCRPEDGGFERCGNVMTARLKCSGKKGHAGMHSGWPEGQVSGSSSFWSDTLLAALPDTQEPKS